MRQEDFLACALAQERTLYRVAKSILCEDADCADAVQDALMKGLSGARRLRDDGAVKGWLTRILINVCRDMQRRRARRPQVPLTEEMEAVLPAPETGRQRELYEALREMDEGLRLPIVLYYLEGFSVREVAALLRLPEGTVKRRLWNGRKRLRETLMEEAL